MRDSLLASRVIHCDETRVQVLKEPDREPSSQSWMWVQTGGPTDKPVILFDYSTSRSQEVPARLLEGFRGYVMTDDYAGYNALGSQAGVERLGCWAHVRRKFVEAQKVQPKGKTGRAGIALNLINELYGIERDLKTCGDAERKIGRHEQSLPILAQLKSWIDQMQRVGVSLLAMTSARHPHPRLVLRDREQAHSYRVTFGSSRYPPQRHAQLHS
jgi:hypothetical protein